jgi:phage repressor protein C with HTH and peptisase S24 domain
MWVLRKVVGDSMNPTLKNGQLVLIFKTRNFKVGDIVMAFMDRREVVKRITKQADGKVFLEGDNKQKSTDSRTHGYLIDRHVMGKVIWPRGL